MEYVKTLPFSGDTSKAFDLAVASLTGLGFQLIKRDDAALILTGPGMGSTRQSALLGASTLQITRNAGELTLTAELGGVQRMTRFIAYFPIGLSLLLAVLFFVIFSLVFDQSTWIIPTAAVIGINALVWLILAPILGRSLRTRTTRALDVLLNNMAVAGETI